MRNIQETRARCAKRETEDELSEIMLWYSPCPRTISRCLRYDVRTSRFCSQTYRCRVSAIVEALSIPVGRLSKQAVTLKYPGRFFETIAATYRDRAFIPDAQGEYGRRLRLQVPLLCRFLCNRPFTKYDLPVSDETRWRDDDDCNF